MRSIISQLTNLYVYVLGHIKKNEFSLNSQLNLRIFSFSLSPIWNIIWNFKWELKFQTKFYMRLGMRIEKMKFQLKSWVNGLSEKSIFWMIPTIRCLVLSCTRMKSWASFDNNPMGCSVCNFLLCISIPCKHKQNHCVFLFCSFVINRLWRVLRYHFKWKCILYLNK